MWSSVKPLVKPNLCSLDVNDIKTLETGGAGATEDVSVKVPVDQDQWGHQRPHVEGHADPAGAHLDPHSRPAAGHGLVVCLRAVPVGEGHHDVQRGQEQHEVEEGVGVGDAVLLVVCGPGLPVAAALLEAVGVGPVLH